MFMVQSGDNVQSGDRRRYMKMFHFFEERSFLLSS